jgi:hypothetical protein
MPKPVLHSLLVSSVTKCDFTIIGALFYLIELAPFNVITDDDVIIRTVQSVLGSLI